MISKEYKISDKITLLMYNIFVRLGMDRILSGCAPISKSSAAMCPDPSSIELPEGEHFFPTRRYASAVYAVVVWLSLCARVCLYMSCLSHTGMDADRFLQGEGQKSRRRVASAEGVRSRHRRHRERKGLGRVYPLPWPTTGSEGAS